MRTRRSALAVAVSLVVVSASCSSTAKKVDAGPRLSATTTTTSSPPRTPKGPGSAGGAPSETVDGTIEGRHLGQTQTGQGGAADTLEVTPTRIVDPGTPATSKDQAQPGSRLVGVELTIKNVGTKSATLEPSSNLVAYGRTGAAYVKAVGATNIKECTGSTEPVHLAVGHTLHDCIVLDVKTRDDVVRLQWNIEGFGDNIPLAWSVP